MRESFLRSAKFVGRKEPLSQLEAATMELSMGQGSAWLIGGESGVGKSRLCAEIKTQALVQGVLVLQGQAHEEDAFAIWRNPLEHLLLHSAISAAEASFLQAYIPDLSLLLDRDIEPLTPMSHEDYQAKFIQLLIDLLRRQKMPVLLILEDLQWANLSMMEAIIGLTKEQPLMLLANYQLEAQIRLENCQQILLQPFDSQEIAELSLSMLGEVGKNP